MTLREIPVCRRAPGPYPPDWNRRTVERAILALLVWFAGCFAPVITASPISVEPCPSLREPVSDPLQCARSGFNRYLAGRTAEIDLKSGGYRLPSRPFALFHEQRTRYSVVLIHGLNDSPYYVRELAGVLHSAGLNVIGILLPGHGTDTREMQSVTAESWREEVDQGLEIASLAGRKVLVGGFSLGGALAIDAALRHRSVRGLVLYAPALRLRWFDSLWALSCLPGIGALTLDTKMQFNPVKYKHRHANGVCQVYRLLNGQLSARTGNRRGGESGRQGARLHQTAAMLRVPVFGVMTWEDARVSTGATYEYFSRIPAPVSLLTFGEPPAEGEPPLTNGGEVVHISDHRLPHGFLVRRSNPYNGQANPYFDQVSTKMIRFLSTHLAGFGPAAQSLSRVPGAGETAALSLYGESAHVHDIEYSLRQQAH